MFLYLRCTELKVKVMEESVGVCIDPEEDEIFFYGVTEKEANVKAATEEESVQDPEVLLGHISDVNKIHEDTWLNIGSTNPRSNIKNVDELEQGSNPMSSVNSCNMAHVDAEGSLKFSDEKATDSTILDVSVKTEEKESNETDDKDDSTNKPVTLEGEISEVNQRNINILEDHNYSTPVKIVIDKNILKTPKSVVKADKDGGFLTVLSEIALVKAEADKKTVNDASVFSKTASQEEITNDDDDDKENVKLVKENISASTKLNEVTPLKSFISAANEVNDKNENDQFTGDTLICKNVSKTTGDTGDAKDIDPIAAERNELPEMEYNQSRKEVSDNAEDFEVVFENITNVGKTEKDSEILVDINNLMKLDSFIHNSSEHCDSSENEGKRDIQRPIIPQINILDETLPAENDNEDCIPLKNVVNTEDEHHKKFLRRRTMNLLHELSEIVSHEQVKRESESNSKGGLSEEAAKVIQKLKDAVIDESIISSDQYFDLDNINETFLSAEMSDILNDTLCKPLDLLTNKDVELLLEKISCTTVEDKFILQTEMAEVLDAEKENLCQNKVQKTFKEKTPNNKGMFQKTPVFLKSKVNTLPSQYNQQKLTPVNKCLFENKTVKQKSSNPIQSQTNQNMIRGCRTAEKAAKATIETRIPKLTSTVSKIPIKGSRDGQIQAKNPILNKTPYHKAPKSLKFNNIKSPIQAYISAKPPVLISNVKGKSETAFNAWMKDMTRNTKTTKPPVETKIAKNVPKTNLPVVNYRSAIPLKLEKSPESRLPRLAPKMQKLILGNSPVVDKHEGRIKLNTNSRPQTSMNESSIMLSPDEVSVIVRKVAVNSNIKK